MSTIGIATNKKLLEIFDMINSEKLILRPYFQRKLVWNDSHKEDFIETILEGLPFPEIYLTDGEIDIERQRSTTFVVDGQQRLSTIYHYIAGAEDFKTKRIKKFSDLSNEEKTNFFDYTIVIRSLGRISEDKTIEIFRRINAVDYALNSIEIQNALYQGEFISTAKKLIETSEVIEKLPIFSENEYSRMKDIEFILLIMSTVEEGGYFTGTKENEFYIKHNDSEYPNKDLIYKDIDEACSLILACDFAYESLWYRKSNFFTLIIELIKLKREKDFLPSKESLKDMLIQFEEQILKNKHGDINNNEFALYYYHLLSSTTSRKGRATRGKILKKYLLNEYNLKESLVA